MALGQINPLETVQKPSKLERAAQIFGLLEGAASIGGKAYDVFSKPSIPGASPGTSYNGVLLGSPSLDRSKELYQIMMRQP